MSDTKVTIYKYFDRMNTREIDCVTHADYRALEEELAALRVRVGDWKSCNDSMPEKRIAMTTSVTDDRQEFEAWAIANDYYMDIRRDGNYASTATSGAWAGYQAAILSQGKVVKSSDLRALPLYEVSNDGFTSSGTPTVERDDEYGDWIKYEDLTAIIGEGD
jgi:hypothetical protein